MPNTTTAPASATKVEIAGIEKDLKIPVKGTVNCVIDTNPVKVESNNNNINKLCTDKRTFILELARDLFLNNSFDNYPDITPQMFAQRSITRASAFYNVAKSTIIGTNVNKENNKVENVYLI